MPRYSLRTAFAAIGLIAAGVALMVYIYRRAYDVRDVPIPLLFGIWYGGAAVVGAGVFLPFRQPWWGLVIGFVVTCAMTTWLAPVL